MKKKTLKERIAELKGKRSLKKRIVTLAAVLSIASAVFGMTGCTEKRTYEKKYGHDYTKEDLYFYKLFDGAIVVNEGGKYVLHKGEVNVFIAQFYQCGIDSSTPELNLDCGETLITSQFVAYKDCVPDENAYDEVCECARDLVKPSKKRDTNKDCGCERDREKSSESLERTR